MREPTDKDRALAAVAALAFAVAFALAWALPEDHTTDRLYRPVREARA